MHMDYRRFASINVEASDNMGEQIRTCVFWRKKYYNDVESVSELIWNVHMKIPRTHNYKSAS